MVFQYINIRQVPWEVLKTAAFGLGFQHLPRDLANVNARKTMSDSYVKPSIYLSLGAALELGCGFVRMELVWAPMVYISFPLGSLGPLWNL